MIAVDTSGRVAITGTTTSADFPVTDGSIRTSGANDTAVAELAPTGASLVYSTLFGAAARSQRKIPAASHSIKLAKFSSLRTPLQPISLLPAARSRPRTALAPAMASSPFSARWLQPQLPTSNIAPISESKLR
jgi:hypothetical protein